MIKSPIDKLIDESGLRCTVCGEPRGCSCWSFCSYCQRHWLATESVTCPQSDEHPVSCVCDKPRDSRRACADARRVPLKNPCRCACHARKRAA